MRKRLIFALLAGALMTTLAERRGFAQTEPPKKLTPQQQKLRDCGAEWQKMKQEGRTAGITWASLRRECLRRK
ncbi:MAG TPA: hypothetical protein VKX28_23030 [Xanthobacteraceae bacterium]|jgi:hypothetical protein|nr:hypothetical protein [Xanthobacteraceae bacterium]